MAYQMDEQRLAVARSHDVARPGKAELSVLGPMERAGFWLTHRMNIGRWKALMTFLQRHIGSLWIYLATYNLMNVFGLENIAATDAARPLVLVANHRSFLICTRSRVCFSGGRAVRSVCSSRARQVLL